MNIKLGLNVPWDGPPVAKPTPSPPNGPLMSAFIRLIEPQPNTCCMFVPGGMARAGYRTKETKQPVHQLFERPRLYGFELNCRDLVYLPSTPEQIAKDYFIQGGCYLAVHLLDDSGTTKAVFVDLDKRQVDVGGLPRVLGALDAANIKYVTERSSSGAGIHIWIVFSRRVLASKAKNWILSVLANAGLKKKVGDDPGDYDEVKPSGGDGGVVIPPHFFADGRACLVAIDAQMNVITLDPAQALAAMDDYQQNPLLADAIDALPDEPVQEKKEGKRGRPKTRNIERLDQAVLAELGLRPLTPEELQDDLERLRFAVGRDKKLRDWVNAGSAIQRGGRSENCFGLIQAMLKLDIHPCTIDEYIRDWPRYSSGTSSATEVLKIIEKAGIRDLLARTGPWRVSIKSTGHVYRDMQTTDQVTVRCLGRAGIDQILRRLQGAGAANDDLEGPRLVVVDASPGSGKTTIAIPEMLMNLRYGAKDCPWPLATLYRERRDNVVESQDWLNKLTEDDLQSG
jgi:hypothetical protein